MHLKPPSLRLGRNLETELIKVKRIRKAHF